MVSRFRQRWHRGLPSGQRQQTRDRVNSPYATRVEKSQYEQGENAEEGERGRKSAACLKTRYAAEPRVVCPGPAARGLTNPSSRGCNRRAPKRRIVGPRSCALPALPTCHFAHAQGVCRNSSTPLESASRPASLVSLQSNSVATWSFPSNELISPWRCNPALLAAVVWLGVNQYEWSRESRSEPGRATPRRTPRRHRR